MKSKLLSAMMVSSLFWAGSVSAEQTETNNVNQVVEQAENVSKEAGNSLSEKTATMTEKMHQTVDKAGQLATETGEKLSEQKATVTEKVNQAVDKAEQMASNAGEKLSETTSNVAEKMDKYIDDATITTKVKRAIADDNLDAGYSISVSTNEGVVTLSGFVPNTEWQLKAVKLAEAVEGVKSVSDKMHIKEDKPVTLKDYSSDARITSEVKAKLLIADNMPLTGIKVETVGGIVQLSGVVKTTEQITNAERIAKTVDGVQTVKNDLVVQP